MALKAWTRPRTEESGRSLLSPRLTRHGLAGGENSAPVPAALARTSAAASASARPRRSVASEELPRRVRTEKTRWARAPGPTWKGER